MNFLVVQCPKCGKKMVHEKRDNFSCRFCKKRIPFYSNNKLNIKILASLPTQELAREFLKQIQESDNEFKSAFENQ